MISSARLRNATENGSMALASRKSSSVSAASSLLRKAAGAPPQAPGGSPAKDLRAEPVFQATLQNPRLADQAKAAVARADKHGTTPLAAAYQFGSLDVVALLLPLQQPLPGGDEVTAATTNGPLKTLKCSPMRNKGRWWLTTSSSRTAPATAIELSRAGPTPQWVDDLHSGGRTPTSPSSS